VLENETDLVEETAAAMRELARTVTYAPPLRLAPRPENRTLRPAPHRWQVWAAPLTAVAAVVVLAISLVLIRDIPNGRVTPPARPAPAVDGGSASTSAGRPTVTTSPSVAQTTASAPATATATAPDTAPDTATAPATSTAPTPTASFTFVPMQTTTGGDFYSPLSGLECEVDDRTGLVVAYCQTTSPARSVTMNATGRYTICTGQQCLANAGEGTPTLFYGEETGVGPFRCESARTGVTCTADGRGFLISSSGITPVPA
jgi:hypothetical protein